MLKLIVTGGRDFYNYEFLALKLSAYKNGMIVGSPVGSGMVLIHGDAEGADKLADHWAKENRISAVAFPATAEMWNLMENQAGNVRNRQMLKGNPEAVVAAFPGPKSRGTFNCMNDAAKLGMRVDLYRVGFADQLEWSKRKP